MDPCQADDLDSEHNMKGPVQQEAMLDDAVDAELSSLTHRVTRKQMQSYTLTLKLLLLTPFLRFFI